MDPCFKHPFTAIMAGPTGYGKTLFTFRLLNEAQDMITPRPQRIMYCYSEYQDVFSDYPEIEFNEG